MLSLFFATALQIHAEDFPAWSGRFEQHFFHLPSPYADGKDNRRVRIGNSEPLGSGLDFAWANGLSWNWELELSDRTVQWEELTLNGESSNYFAWELGLFKEPLGLDGVTSSRFIAMTERNFVATLTKSDNTGFMLSHSSPSWNAAFGVFGKVMNGGLANGDNALSGRVVWRPWREGDGQKVFHLGLSASARQTQDGTVRWDSTGGPTILPTLVDSGILLVDRLSQQNAEISWASGSFSTSAECSTVALDGGDGGNAYAWSCQAAWIFTGEHRQYRTSNGSFGKVVPLNPWSASGLGAWELICRTDRLKLPSQGQDSGCARQGMALTCWLESNVHLQLGWDRIVADGDAAFEAWTLRLAYDW